MPEDVVHTWGALLKVHAALVPRFDRELQETHGLPLTWYDVRLELNAAPDRRLTMGELLVEGSTGVIRLDGYARLYHRPFGSNEEELVPYEWANVGFAGNSVLRLQRHVVDHLQGRGPVVNRARDYLVNLRIEEAIYRSSARGACEIVRS